jgi:hypothetical protein
MGDPNDSVREKVSAIFRELVGSRERELDGSVESVQTKRAIAAALAQSYDADTATKVALHMSDWNSDAAFIVALHLFPERFTPDEIEAGMGLFLVHTPNHVREACRLTGQYVWEDFPYEDQDPDQRANETRQPTPARRLVCSRARVARRGCAFR